MRDGFEALYRAHYAAVRRYVDRRLAGPNVDDVVAATFELALRRLNDSHPHPVGWLIRTAENLVKAEIRRQQRERHAARDAEIVAQPSSEDPDIEILRSLMRSLPEAQRTVLQLIYWDGLTAAEAGIVLGCSAQVVWKRVSRAKSALRAAWATVETPATWEEVMTNA